MFALLAWPGPARSAAPIYDPVALNVGVSCRWERSCQQRQLKAMARARDYVARAHPPLWRIHLCNRNARRGTARVDWIGFNGCIRNQKLAQPLSRGR
ncbi:MAG: hypothetical protein ACM3ZV_14195 [Bacillota bacterium]